MANKPRAPVAVLSPTKRTAVIECFGNNGLHKRNGYWWGAPESKHISGVTVADLARDGMFVIVTNLRQSSARLEASLTEGICVTLKTGARENELEIHRGLPPEPGDEFEVLVRSGRTKVRVGAKPTEPSKSGGRAIIEVHADEI